MHLLILDAPTSIGSQPVRLTLRTLGAPGAALAGPLLFLPNPELLAAGMIAASPAVVGGGVWVVAAGAPMHLAAGTCLGHGVALSALPAQIPSQIPGIGGAGALPPQGLKPAPPTIPAPAPLASAGQAQSKAKGKPSPAALDPTA